MIVSRTYGPTAVMLGTAALLGPLLALLAPLGFAPLFILVSTGAIILTWRQQMWRQLPRPLLIMTAIVVTWAALSALWAVDPLRSLRSAGVLGLTTLAGLWLMTIAGSFGQLQRVLVLRCLLIGVIIALIYVMQDIVLHGAATIRLKGLPLEMNPEQLGFLARQHLSRGIIILVLVSWVTAAFLSRHPLAAAAILALTTVAALWSWSASSKLAMGIAVMAALLAGWRHLRMLALAVIATLTMAIPIAAHNLPGPAETAQWTFMPFTNHHRLTIWQFVGQRIAEKPLLGWGMDSARDMPGGEDISVIWVGPMEVPEQVLPLHPHNGVLQWWLELGAVGAVLIGLWLAMAAWRAYAHRPDRAFFDRALGPALFSGVVLVGLVSFGFWQNWWQSFLWLLASWATIAWQNSDHD